MADGTTSERQIVVFDLAREAYAVDIHTVREIIRHQAITKTPGAPPAVEGMINLRGKVIPVVDLRKRFGLRAQALSHETRILVVDIHNEAVGAVVDAVTEVLRLPGSAIEPPPRMALSSDVSFVDGIVSTNERLLILLDLEQALSAEALARVVLREDADEPVVATSEPMEESSSTAPEPSGPTLADLDIELLEATFEAVKPRAAELVEYFYARLFEEHPGVLPLFANADMQEQQGKLLSAIATVVASLRSPDVLVPHLQRLGERHVAYGAQPAHYDAVGAILLESLAYIAGDAWSAPVAAAWGDAYTVAANVMRDAAAALVPERAAA